MNKNLGIKRNYSQINFSNSQKNKLNHSTFFHVQKQNEFLPESNQVTEPQTSSLLTLNQLKNNEQACINARKIIDNINSTIEIFQDQKKIIHILAFSADHSIYMDSKMVKELREILISYSENNKIIDYKKLERFEEKLKNNKIVNDELKRTAQLLNEGLSIMHKKLYKI